MVTRFRLARVKRVLSETKTETVASHRWFISSDLPDSDWPHLRHDARSLIYLFLLLARKSRLSCTSMLFFLCLPPMENIALSALHL
jgi:hypothetical protein